MYRFFRPFLFQLDPEETHHVSLLLLRYVGKLLVLNRFVSWIYQSPQRPVNLFGLTFSNPLGIAAGYDKDGLAWRGLACLGFGHIEIGTVTPRPQGGNPQPRIFRLPKDHAIINRMGFPGKGARFVKNQLGGLRPPGLILGLNMGVNKDTPIEQSSQDYQQLINLFSPSADYLVINVSSPNSLGLRRLQAKVALDDLLSILTQVKSEQESILKRPVPLLVKISPDLTDPELYDAIEVILSRGIDGVIATNTTLNRRSVVSERASEAGGLSGVPLRELSTQIIFKIAKYTNGILPIIGVGGVMCVEDVREKLDAGAHLVQIYTGLVYQGPGLGRHILRRLSRI
jgi:dihydroorotate dehydrogenase